MGRFASIRRFAGAVTIVVAMVCAGLVDGARAASSTTAVVSSLNPSSPGQSVTFTATVSGSTAGAPTGSVTFSDGGSAMAGAVTVNTLGVGGSITAGWYHSCALTTGAGIRCWGDNDYGQLGDTTTTDRLAPVDVSGLGSGVAAVAAGQFHTCALTNSGGVKCWGSNEYGQVGDGTTTDRHIPVDVVGLTSGVVAIASGYGHSCAVTTAGGVKCWGFNRLNQLGDFTSTNAHTPVEVMVYSEDEGILVPMRGIAAVSTRGEHTCALTTAGGVRCWGNDFYGEVGDRDDNGYVVGLSSGVVAIAAGGFHTCALTTGGGVKCWGTDLHGALGDNGFEDQSTPVDVVGLGSGVAAIATGDLHGCALTTGGAVKCWGYNPDGEVGDGTDTHRLAPVDVVGLSSGVAAITAGFFHTCALTALGGMQCWGTNADGEAGDGTTTSPRKAPVPVTDFGGGATLVFGKATLATSSLTSGSHSITASYSGDGGHTGSTSAALTQAVSKSPTTASLGANVDAGKFGQSVTFTATVTAGATGTVTFKDGGTTLGSGNVSGGVAMFSTAALDVGGHSITATYGGDSTYDVSTSSGVSYTVSKGSTTLAASVTPASVSPNAQVTLTATVAVTAPASATPAGTVTFQDSGGVLGVGTVIAGVAQATAAPLAIGRHIVTATYSGDSHLDISSATTTFTVSAAATAEAKANAFSKGSQQFPAIARLKNGYVAVWASEKQDGNGYGIYGQRYDDGGAKVGAELHVSTAKAGNQVLPKVAGLPSGSFIVVWHSDVQDNGTSGIYGQLFAASGKPSGKEFRVNTTAADAQYEAVVAAQGSGFVIAWTSDSQDKSGAGIYARRYNAKGKPLGGEFKVNTTTKGDQSAPVVAGLDRGFVIVWQSADKKGLGIFGQRYDVGGKAAGKQFAINKTTAGDQSLPSIAGLDDGGFVVGWQMPDGSGTGIYFQRFTKSGAKSGGEVRANTYTAGNQSEPSLSAFADGGFGMLWTSQGQDGSGRGIYAQLFKSDGSKANVEFLVNTTMAGDQSQPAVAAGSAGSFMAVWVSRSKGSAAEDVFTTLFQVPMQ